MKKGIIQVFLFRITPYIVIKLTAIDTDIVKLIDNIVLASIVLTELLDSLGPDPICNIISCLTLTDNIRRRRLPDPDTPDTSQHSQQEAESYRDSEDYTQQLKNDPVKLSLTCLNLIAGHSL